MYSIAFHMSYVYIPDIKVHGTNVGPIWGRQDPGGPHFVPMNFVIWDDMIILIKKVCASVCACVYIIVFACAYLCLLCGSACVSSWIVSVSAMNNVSINFMLDRKVSNMHLAAKDTSPRSHISHGIRMFYSTYSKECDGADPMFYRFLRKLNEY